VTFGGCGDFCIRDRLAASATFGRGDQPAPSVVRCQNAMVAGEVDPRLGYQGRQPRDEIYRVKDHLGRSVAIGRLQVVDHLAGGWADQQAAGMAGR
jgi:hypothetical protein